MLHKNNLIAAVIRMLWDIFFCICAVGFSVMHFFFTGPVLWRQSSSSAFDMYVFLTVVSIILLVWSFIWLWYDNRPRKYPVS